MRLYWTYLAGIAAVIAVGFGIGYAALRRRLQQALAEQQQATERQLAALAAKITTLEDKVTALSLVLEQQASTAPEFEMATGQESVPAPAPVAVGQEGDLENEEVPAEMVPVLAAAATAFLGRKVRILSARKLQSPRQGMSPWSQQGRVFVQASHNLWARS